MTEHFGFFDAIQDSNGHYDREYNAQQWNEPFRALVTTGVMKGAYNQLEVTANGANMVSAVKSGIAFIEGRFYYNDALVELIHDTEVMGLSRIDRIVVRMDSRTEARHVKTFIKKGVPSTSPIAPTLTQAPTVYEISLAQVRVVGGQTYIAADAVTDERGKDVICPWAGSNILPNFNADSLQELVNKVEGLYPLTDGPYAKEYNGDLNDLTESGIYSVPANTPNAPNTLPLLVEVKTSSNGEFVIQTATYDHLATSGIPSFTRRALKNASGDLVWSKPSQGAVGFVGDWRITDYSLSDELTNTATNQAATANAVKQVNDKIDGKLRSGTEAPEGVVTAPIGTIYTRTMGGDTTTLYIKTSGTGNTGWTAK